MLRVAKILFITVLFSVSFAGRAQLLTNLGPYRNQLFLNTGYYLSFANYSLGWIHKEHVKLIKRDVMSILDFSFPISHNFYTRFVFRKGIQTNIWQDSTWRIPITILGSSDKVISDILRIHNFVTDIFLNPGIYKRGYTIALDLDYKVIWVSHIRKTTPDGANAVEKRPVHSKVAAGLALGINYGRFTYLLRSGYQQTADLENHPYNFYAILQLGFNCNFKKAKK